MSNLFAPKGINLFLFPIPKGLFRTSFTLRTAQKRKPSYANETFSVPVATVPRNVRYVCYINDKQNNIRRVYSRKRIMYG